MSDLVQIRLYAAARAAAGRGEAAVPAGSLAAVLAALVSLPGTAADLPEVLGRCSFLVDGVAVHGATDRIHVPVDARLDVLPPFAGG